MSSSIAKATAAIAISVWMGLLACLAGCLPAFARGASPQISGKCDVAKQDQMANMECCHRTDNPSHDKKKQSPENASCCPLDATLIQKGDAPRLAAAASVHVPFVDYHFALRQSSRRLESSQTIWHSGRDTLLETHLLRI